MSFGAGNGSGAPIAGARSRANRAERDFATMLGVPDGLAGVWESRRGGDASNAALPRSAAGAPPPSVDAPLASLRPQRVWMDGDFPEPIASAWRLRAERRSAPTGDARRGGGSPTRPSALLLALPGATILDGGREEAYCAPGGKAAHGRDELVLSVVRKGRRCIEQRGRVAEGGSESAVFAASVESGHYSTHAGGQFLAIYVPAQPLEARAADVHSRLVRPIAADDPALKLLSAYVSALMKSEQGLDPEAASAVADHLIDLCALLLGARGDEKALAQTRGLRAAQRAAVVEAIEAGATTPGFSVHTVAEQLGVAPRYVHFLLEEGGSGFAALVAARRLRVVRERLDDPTFDAMSVPELALSCGFPDLKHFHRQFGARFGAQAAAVRAGRSAMRRP